MSERWPRVPLGDLLRRSTEIADLLPGSEYQEITVRLWGKGVIQRRTFSAAEIFGSRRFLARSGQLIVSRIDARNGALGIVPDSLDRALVTNDFPVFGIDRTLLDARFIAWLTKTRSFVELCQRASEGTTNRVRLNEARFLALEIPLPPLIEQQRIVARIEELDAKIAEARMLRMTATAEHVALARASVAEVFTRAQSRSTRVPLRDCVELRGGGTPSKSDPALWGGGIPWVTPKDMKVRDIYSSRDTITSAGIASSPAKLIAAGAVLVVVRGMILAHTFPSAVLRVPATINQDMKALIPCDRLNADFLVEFLWAFNGSIVEMVQKSTHDTRKFTTARLLGIDLPLPSIREQRRIVDETKAMRTRLCTIADAQSNADAQLDALLPSILDRAFKGEL